MIDYPILLEKLRALSDPQYRAFHQKLLKDDKINVLGVRVPVLRRLAAEYVDEIAILADFPDEYYEVGFLKCACASLLPYDTLLLYIDRFTAALDNWATCDCFSPRCIKTHREEFLPYIEKYFTSEREFQRRFALTTLLHFYVEKSELPVVFSYLRRCGGEKYYVAMAAGWLLAETLGKYYGEGKRILESGEIGSEIARLGIRKACESRRLSAAQKDELRAIRLKIRENG